MLKLNGDTPIKVEMGDGASVTLAPPSPRIVAAGRRATRKAFDDNADAEYEEATIAFSEGVLLEATTAWNGIGDASGKPLPCTRENVARALTDHHFFSRLEVEYVGPIIAREQEKNASTASSAGTTKAATAGKTTAASPADTPKPKRRRTKTDPKP